MRRNGEESASSAASGAARLPLARVQVLGWIAVGVVVFVVFELALYLTAVTLFTHVDTPECAGSNTFCSPEGRTGLTGGAVVVLAGNVVAAVAVTAALVRSRRPRNG